MYVEMAELLCMMYVYLYVCMHVDMAEAILQAFSVEAMLQSLLR